MMPDIQEIQETKALEEIEKGLQSAEIHEFFESTEDFDPREFVMRRC